MVSHGNGWTAGPAIGDAHAYSPPAYPTTSPFNPPTEAKGDDDKVTSKEKTASEMPLPPAYDFVMANSDQFKIREEK